jgi:transcription-repair coupling factor (superfamily II helicase)
MGFKLYLKLIKRALGFRFDYEEEIEGAYIPEDYIKSPDKRVEYYIRLAEGELEEEVEAIYNEMVDIFGEPPHEVERLIEYHISRVRGLLPPSQHQSFSLPHSI